jgi:tetratricopeptide (TPR) repeat protein
LNYDYNISEDELKFIEGYLTKTLESEERDAFEKELLQNKALQQKTEELRLLILGIQEASLKVKLPEFHQGIDHNQSSVPINVRKKFIFSRWVIAASILFFVSLGVWALWLRQPLHEKLYSTHYYPDPGLATVMSKSDSYDFEKAMVAYKNGDYQQALNAWEGLLAQKPTNDTLLYFMGSAELAMGKYERAKEKLESVARNNTSVFQHDAYWYLGLYYLRTNQIKSAIDYLNQSNYPEASALINEIKKS